jgi:HD-like signal output (HDOD) protein
MLTAQEIITNNTELASPPDIYLKITETLDAPSKNAQDLAEIINLDPGLATRVLRIVNSALYSFSANITSISHAVSIIGAKELKNVVLTTIIVDRFSQSSNDLISTDQFWSLSVKAALFSKALGKHHKEHSKMDALFICGLLHKVGLFIIYNKLPEQAHAATLLSQTRSISEAEAQNQLLGFNYADVGSALAKQWKLPEVIQVTLQNQLNPKSGCPYAVETAVLSLARSLSEMKSDDETALSDLLELTCSLWEGVGLDKEILKEVIPEVNDQFSETYQMIHQH